MWVQFTSLAITTSLLGFITTSEFTQNLMKSLDVQGHLLF
jgi:hypothetical protein